MVLALVLTACPACKRAVPDGRTGSTGQTSQVDGAGFTPKDWSSVSLEGAGASFPAPIYQAWAYNYEELTKMKVNYQSVGSGAGIAQIQAKTVDFGASDAPLKLEELDQSGLIQFPLVIGGVVPVVNIPGILAGGLKLTGNIVAGMYMGSITKWNDPAIAQFNPGLNLPDMPIVVVHRADGSGTTWIFTSYLDAVSGEWHTKVGAGKSVEWLVGVGGRGNEGVSSNVQQLQGSIGYVEYAYATQNELVYVQLQNKYGSFVNPSVDTFQAAAASADWGNAPGYYMVLVDQPGYQTWPITGASFILIQKNQDDPNRALGMLEFFDWCMRYGGQTARQMDYVPVPMNLVESIERTWEEQVVSGDQKVWGS